MGGGTQSASPDDGDNYAIDITGWPTGFAPMSTVLAQDGNAPDYGTLLGAAPDA